MLKLNNLSSPKGAHKNIKRIGFLEKGNGVKFYDNRKKQISLSKTGYSHF